MTLTLHQMQEQAHLPRYLAGDLARFSVADLDKLNKHRYNMCSASRDNHLFSRESTLLVPLYTEAMDFSPEAVAKLQDETYAHASCSFCESAGYWQRAEVTLFFSQNRRYADFEKRSVMLCSNLYRCFHLRHCTETNAEVEARMQAILTAQ